MSEESIFFGAIKPPEGATAEKTSEGYPYFQDQIHVDQSKDVPLAASALHKDGQMYGIAVDKDAPITDMGIKGWSPFHGVHVHEKAEFHHMNHLMLGGMSPQDAYHEAHDKIATPTETAYVRGVASAHGKDPDRFLDQYKQYWRDVASNASQKENPDRHPDAHTTTFGLDEAELNKKFSQGEIPFESLSKDQQNYLLKGWHSTLGGTFKNKEEVLKFMEENPHPRLFRDDPGVKDLLEHLPDDIDVINFGDTEGENRSVILHKRNALVSQLPGNTAFEKGVLNVADYLKTFSEKGLFGVAKKAGYNPPGESVSKALTSEPVETTLGLFGGIKAKGALTTILEKGYFRGAEGKIRFEIPDTNARIKDNKVVNTLEDILHHSELYRAYPELKSIKINMNAPFLEDEAIQNPYTREIHLGPYSSLERLKQTLLHEVQHFIQDIEGFVPGTSISSIEPYVRKAVEKLGLNPSEKEIKQAAFDAYQRVAGEVESRNVEYRSVFKPKELKQHSPIASQSFPFEQQLDAPKESYFSASQQGYGGGGFKNVVDPEALKDLPAPLAKGGKLESRGRIYRRGHGWITEEENERLIKLRKEKDKFRKR